MRARSQRSQHINRRLIDVGKFAHAGQCILAACNVFGALSESSGNSFGERFGCKRSAQSAFFLDGLKQRPCMIAKLLRQRFKRAAASGGIRNAREMRFFQQHQLRVARAAAGKGIGQAQRLREGQHTDAIRAANASREYGDRCAQHVHERIAPRHHAPRRFSMHMRCGRAQAAGNLYFCPQTAQRAQFGDAKKFIRINRNAKRDGLGGIRKAHALSFQCAQAGQSRGERIAQFLRFRSACGMNAPCIGDKKWPGKALLGKTHGKPGAARVQRIKAEGDACGFGINLARGNQAGERVGCARIARRQIELDRDFGIEIYILKGGP